MKKTFAYAIGGVVGALTLAAAAIGPAQAAPVTAHAIAAVQADVVLANHKGHKKWGQNGRRYYGNWRQSDWHQRHYRQNRNHRYGPKYRHNNYGNVRPFATFIRILAGAGYRNFHRPVFYGQGRNWTPHYYVNARDGYGRSVNLRVCAYTGNVLGWRYH